jgi:hypothetical protein
MAANTIQGDLKIVGGNLVLAETNAVIKPDRPRSNSEKEPLVAFPIDLTSFVVWDSHQPLPATSATDDIGHYTGTFGTANNVLSSGDVKNSTTTRYARVRVRLPESYEAGANVRLRFAAGTKTTIASTSSTLDVEAYLVGRDTLVSGSDLCTTSATTINSTTFADKDFVITGSGLEPGDELDIRITLACADTATATAVTPTVAAASILCDIRG